MCVYDQDARTNNKDIQNHTDMYLYTRIKYNINIYNTYIYICIYIYPHVFVCIFF